MRTSHPEIPSLRKPAAKWAWPAVGLFVFAAIGLIILWKLPFENSPNESAGNSESPTTAEAHEDDHADHDEHGHAESESIALSPQARKNIGLKTGEVELTNADRSITVPAIVTERPGETTFHIAAPLTGVVTGLSIVRGEAVESGKLLFTLRLTHEDLVQVQTDYLRLLEQLDVERKELARLKEVNPASIPRKTLLEREYEIDKIEAQLKAQAAALELHGLSKAQVGRISQTRELLREVTVQAPFLHADGSMHDDAESNHGPENPVSQGAQSAADDPSHDVKSRQFVVQTLEAHTGEAVQAGQKLCVLVDYGTLFVEGRAFEQDADEILKAKKENRTVTVLPESGTKTSQAIEGLNILYVANEIEQDSRALHFYVNLPNTALPNGENSMERKFISWKHKPGQRMQIRVPVDVWQDIIKLPVDAIAEEGPERYVFVENGDHFDRRPVHVIYRDQFDAIIENDGSLYVGETVALTSAHQLQMALKNKAGGPVDPHAGHTH